MEKLTTDDNGPDIDRAVREVLSHISELKWEIVDPWYRLRLNYDTLAGGL